MTDSRRIADPHQHLWDFGAVHYPWLKGPHTAGFLGSRPEYETNYRVADYRADAKTFNLVKSVHIEARSDAADPVAETAWLQAQSERPGNDGFPHGIVAYGDLMADNFVDIAAAHASYPNFRGIRQILSWVTEPYMRDARWRANFSRFRDLGLIFDMQINPGQMRDAAALAADYPDTRISLNHTGMPDVTSDRGIAAWRSGMRLLAACENVTVKLAGFGMHDPTWTAESIRPLVLETIDLFGPSRCMFASNFPVDRPFRSFFDMWTAFFEITAEFSETEKSQMFHDNAVALYRL